MQTCGPLRSNRVFVPARQIGNQRFTNSGSDPRFLSQNYTEILWFISSSYRCILRGWLLFEIKFIGLSYLRNEWKMETAETASWDLENMCFENRGKSSFFMTSYISLLVYLLFILCANPRIQGPGSVLKYCGSENSVWTKLENSPFFFLSNMKDRREVQGALHRHLLRSHVPYGDGALQGTRHRYFLFLFRPIESSMIGWFSDWNKKFRQDLSEIFRNFPTFSEVFPTCKGKWFVWKKSHKNPKASTLV